MLYQIILASHNAFRWLVVLAGVWAGFRVWRGWMSRAGCAEADLNVGRLFVNATSIRFVLGLVLYAISPLIRQGMADMGTAMRTAGVRYFMVEHVFMMLVSIALAHIGLAKVKKATTDSARFQSATIWWGIAVASVLGFIPWNRPLLPF
ncbi:MAG: hypothetical protein IPK85_04280 [Gemmatimonadetes bacterium]|nr:hypothetical protein [Gemmatimonadota bacterium]